MSGHNDPPNTALPVDSPDLPASPSRDRQSQDGNHTTWPIQLSHKGSPGPHPPAPIPIPSPALGARGLADQVDPFTSFSVADGDEPDLEAGTDGMAVDFPGGLGRKEGKRNIVGEFISGLRKLPKAFTKSSDHNERRTDRANDLVFAALKVSESHLTHPISSSPEHPDPPSHVLSSDRADGEQATFSSQRGSPTIGNSDDTHENLQDGDSAFTHHEPSVNRELHDGETLTTSVHPEPSPAAAGLSSPVFVEPQLSSDYAKMDSPIVTPPNPSLASYVSRLRQFLKSVNDLPWIAPRTTVDYIPGQSSPRTHSRRQTMLSWYATPHQSIDLLSSGSSEMTRLPDSSTTLVYQPHFNKGTGEGGPPCYPDTDVPLKSNIISQESGRHTRSNSVQIYGPPLQRQVAGNRYPYPIVRPPPARTS